MSAFLKGNLREGDGMVSVYHMLFNVISGLKEMQEEGFNNLSKKLHTGFHQFIYLNGQSGIEPPRTIPDFISLLHNNAGEWGINDIEEHFPLNRPLLDNDTGISFEADEFLEVMKNPEEYEQNIMKSILIYCRENNLQEEYTKIRKFLSNPKHAVITRKQLFIFLVQITHDELSKYVESCYERVINISNYRICPYCKWTLKERAGNWHCNDGGTCHLQAEFMNFNRFEESKQQYLRMKRGIHRYTLLPGIAEHKIAKKLEKRGYEISMYPKIDEADILVEKDGNRLILDVKDHYSPLYFAKHIKQQYKEENLEGVWFVIPRARLEIFPGYIDQAKNYYGTPINLVSENELYKRVGDFLL